MKFKEFFNQYIFQESPDGTKTPSGDDVDYYHGNLTFFCAKDFTIFSKVVGITHQQMIRMMHTYCNHTLKYDFGQEGRSLTSKSGNVINITGNIGIFRELFENHDINDETKLNRNDLIAVSEDTNSGMFVGRVWAPERMISFWNGLNDFKKFKTGYLEKFLKQFLNVSLTKYDYEYEGADGSVQTTLDFLRNPVSKEYSQTKKDIPFHMLPPEKKAQYMKLHGITPKKAKPFDPNKLGD